MESVVRRAEIDFEQLSPSMQTFSSFSSSTLRRIHLDSSSHRSLVRILSHCLGHSFVTPSSASEITLAVKDLTSGQGRGELHLEQEACANTNGKFSDKIREKDLHADVGVEKGVSAAGGKLVELDHNNFDANKIVARSSKEELSGGILDSSRLIDAPNEQQSWESHEMSGQDGRPNIVHDELEIAEPHVHGAEEGISHLTNVSEVAMGERVSNSLKQGEGMREKAEDVGVLVTSEPVESVLYDKVMLVETQDSISHNAEEEREGTKQQAEIFSSSLANYSGLRNFMEGQVSTLAHHIGEAEVEEGEISDEAQNLEEVVDIIANEEVLEDQSKVRLRSDNSAAIFIHKKEVFEAGVDLSDTSEEDSPAKPTKNKPKVMDSREKKMNGHLTDKRKAKKKLAKKRKRAQKNRDQGVKKLKLLANVKPKEAKYCNFYRMGRCQQGDFCKFSHDIVPLTKSMPCKHFAYNSCLKGDDCSYDHELSKYPCHNYVSSGSCIRGERCKFSHKMEIADASSLSTVGKAALHMTSEQPKFRNQPVGAHFPLDGGLYEGKNKGKPALMEKPLKDSSKLPKGIQFISFGTKPTEGLLVNKPCHTAAYNHQKEDNFLVHGVHNAPNSFRNSSSPKNSLMPAGLASKASSNTFATMDSSNHKVSEAAKILEEFLFCGAG